MDRPYQASCTCGKVTFQSVDRPVIQLVCHCTDCRAATGNDFSNIAFFRSKTAVISGEVAQKEFVANSGSSTRREYCPHCNTIMLDKSDGFSKLIGVFAQQLATPFEFTPAAHVWVQSKLPHVDIADVPQFSQGFKA